MLANDNDDDNASPPHWNPQLVAQLEAERAQGLPRRKPVDLDPPAEGSEAAETRHRDDAQAAVTWVNLDDQMPEHPKVAGLSDAAFRLHVAGICYSNRFLTDGLISAPTSRRLVPQFRISSLRELVQKGLWIEVLSDTGGDAFYEIHDYLEWNKSRADVEKQRDHLTKIRSEAGRKGAEKRWQGHGK